MMHKDKHVDLEFRAQNTQPSVSPSLCADRDIYIYIYIYIYMCVCVCVSYMYTFSYGGMTQKKKKVKPYKPKTRGCVSFV